MLQIFDKISEFFTWFVDTAKALIEFVWNIIDGTMQLLELLPSATETLTESLTWLPSILVGFSATTITVSIIFLIIGRTPGGKSGD